MNQLAIQAQGLSKKFPRRDPKDESLPWYKKLRQPKTYFTAVNGIDLEIQSGEIFGLLGPNGAGKSTTIRMLCTLVEPTGGRAWINGYDLRQQPSEVRRSLGTVLAGDRSIYWKLTGRENLEYFAAIFHIPTKIARQRISELLQRMELEARADELVEKYSTGMKQRIAISKALLARPPILLLDEPTLGLDPQAARRVRELITELKAEGHTILITTHYMEEADQLSDRIGIIDQGRIIALDTPAELKRQIQHKDILRLEVSGWKPEVSQTLNRLPQVEELTTRRLEADSLWEVTLHTGSSRAILPAILECVNTNGTHLVNLKVVEPSLEDVFIHLTGKALRD